LTSWSVFGKLLDDNSLGVLVDAVAILGRQSISLIILGGESIVVMKSSLRLILLGEVILIIVVLDLSLLGLFAVVDGCLDLGLDHTHLGNDSLNLHKLVDQWCFQTTGSHVVFTEVAFKIDVISLHLLGEIVLILHGLLLLVLLATALAEVFHVFVQLVFKIVNSLDGVLPDEVGEPRVELAHFVNAHVKASPSSNEVFNPVLAFIECQELDNGLLHVTRNLVGAFSVVAAVKGS